MRRELLRRRRFDDYAIADAAPPFHSEYRYAPTRRVPPPTLICRRKITPPRRYIYAYLYFYFCFADIRQFLRHDYDDYADADYYIFIPHAFLLRVCLLGFIFRLRYLFMMFVYFDFRHYTDCC